MSHLGGQVVNDLEALMDTKMSVIEDWWKRLTRQILKIKANRRRILDGIFLRTWVMVVGVVGMTFPEERSKRVLSKGLEPKLSFFGAIDDDAIVDCREKFLNGERERN